MKGREQLTLDEGMVEGEQRCVENVAKVATVTPTKALAIAANHKQVSSALIVANTRKIGKKYHIQLKKGNDGLGFSITTRDNPAGGNCPIYIKTILPKGAAVEDGNLRTGDRLLEVCGIEMTGQSQSDAVKILRTIPLGTKVDLIVSRQEVDVSPSPTMPRQLPPEKSAEIACNEREALTFEIPLNDTGSAGLGVSVKGKTSTLSGQNTDLGIFVKTVIYGGAASKDGRLKTNDQLININGIPLLGMTNSQAMESLRRAMIQSEGPIANPNAITLTVARRLSPYGSNLSAHQRNDSLLSDTSDSNGEEVQSSSERQFSPTNKVDEAYDSYQSNENTVIYRSRSDFLNSLSNSQLPATNTTFLKKYYLSDNHDSNAIYEKCANERNDVVIEHDIHECNGNADHESSVDELSAVPNSTPQYDTRHSNQSLNDESADGFRRDGFGRQTMSEKHHTQLDAKNTDTYKRNKKAKEEKERKQKELKEQESKESKEKVTVNSTTQTSQSHLNRVHAVPHDSVAPNFVIIQRYASDDSVNLTGVSQSHYNNRKCGSSPGSCPYHSSQTQKNEMVGPSLRLKKSSSLESLQTMMQDLQIEQLEQVGALIGPRHATVRVPRVRDNLHALRSHVGRSYYNDHNNVANRDTMETVTEENVKNGLPAVDRHRTHQMHGNPTSRTSGALSVTSTQFTGTTATSSQSTNDDETANLFKKKNSVKKKGLFKTWFKFGSKRGRTSPSKNLNDINKTQSKQMDQNSIENAAQKYILEQERIQMHYRRLMEQQKQQSAQQQGSHSAQPTPPVRNKLKTLTKQVVPLHSTPTPEMTTSLQRNGHIVSRNERMQQIRAQHQRMQAERQVFYPKDAEIYVPPKDSDIYVPPKDLEIYVSAHHNCRDRNNRVLPTPPPNMTPHYLNPNFQARREVPRVGVADQNSKYSHYMNYQEIQRHMQQYHHKQQQQQQQQQQHLNNIYYSTFQSFV